LAALAARLSGTDVPQKAIPTITNASNPVTLRLFITLLL